MKRIGILLVSWTATYRFLMASDPGQAFVRVG